MQIDNIIEHQTMHGTLRRLHTFCIRQILNNRRMLAVIAKWQIHRNKHAIFVKHQFNVGRTNIHQE